MQTLCIDQASLDQMMQTCMVEGILVIKLKGVVALVASADNYAPMPKFLVKKLFMAKFPLNDLLLQINFKVVLLYF